MSVEDTMQAMQDLLDSMPDHGVTFCVNDSVLRRMRVAELQYIGQAHKHLRGRRRKHESHPDPTDPEE